MPELDAAGAVTGLALSGASAGHLCTPESASGWCELVTDSSSQT